MVFASKQQLEFTFTGGLDAGLNDQFTVKAPSVLQMENGTFNKNGTIDTRFGFEELPNQLQTGGVIHNGTAINTFEDELLFYDNSNLYSYLTSTQSWITRGAAISCINSGTSVMKSRISTQTNPDGIETNQYLVFAWEDSRGGSRYAMLDGYTQTFIVADTSLYQTGGKPKPLTNSQGNIAIVLAPTFSDIGYYVLNTSRPQLLPSLTLPILDGYSVDGITPTYDAILEDNQTVPTIAYATNSNFVTLVTPTSRTSVPTVGVVTAISLTKDSVGHYWVAWLDTGLGIRIASFNGAGTLVLGSHTVISSSSPTTSNPVSDVQGLSVHEDPQNPGSVTVAWDNIDVLGLAAVWCAEVYSNAHVVINSSPIITKVALCSKLFTYNRQLFALTTLASVVQPTQFLLQLNALSNTRTIVSKLNAQAGSPTYRSNHSLPEVTSTQAGKFMIATSRTNSFQAANNTFLYNTGVQGSWADFQHANVFSSIEFANNLLTCGGYLQTYDGFSYVENNFHVFPELPSIVLTSGGNLLDGVYGYVVIYEWCDNKGQSQRSQPSVVQVVTASAGQKAILLLPTISLTNKLDPRSPILITVYRTQANIPGVYYKLMHGTMTGTQVNGSVVNDITVDYIPYSDTNFDDTAFLSDEPVYTDSQLPNCSPPSASLIALFRNRVVLAGLEDPLLMYFSQAQEDNSNFNTLPPEFSPFLTLSVSKLGGPITAIYAMDDKLIIWKEHHIFYTAGDGPDALGQGQSFAVPQLLTSTVGCVNPNSIVDIPSGLIFLSDQGFYLLGRDSSATNFIGAQVKDYTSAPGFTVTSAEKITTNNTVVFTTNTGTMLIYNYVYGRWSTWTNLPAQDSVIWNEQLTICTDRGFISTQQEMLFSDTINGVTSGISQKVQLPWLGFGNTQSEGHIYYFILLGHFKGPHALKISIAYDYQDQEVEFATISSNLVSNTWGSAPSWGVPGEPWGGGEYTPYQFLIDPESSLFRQSIRITIWGAQPVNSDGEDILPYTDSFQLVSLQASVGILPNSAIVPASNKIGSTTGPGQ